MRAINISGVFLLLAAAACGQQPAAKTGAGAQDSEGGLANSTGPAVPVPLAADTRFCLDVANGGTENGTPVQLFWCNNLPTQNWKFVNGSFQALGKCLTVNDDLANGSPVQLADCKEAARGQQFGPGDNGGLRVVGSNKCIDLPSGTIANFTPLQLYDCSGGPNQNWHLPPLAGEGKQIRSRANVNYCFDLPNGRAVDGAAAQIFTCNDTHAQHWDFYPDGSVRVDGLCLDDPDNARRAGDQLQLWHCLPQENQQWVRVADAIQLKGTNLCVDIPNGNTTNGVRLQLSECTQNANQTWTF